MRTMRALVIAVALLTLPACVSKEERSEVKAIVLERYPQIEQDIQKAVIGKYGKQIFAKQKWEWHIEAAEKRNQWKVQYGCFRTLSKGEVFAGDFVKDLSGELTGGLLSYHPKAEGKGVYVEILVDSKTRTIAMLSAN